MLLPKRQGKEWISGRNCWQLHGRTHRPLEVMAQDRTGHWRVERCPEATSHESSQVWLQVWRFFFCNGSWEHNSRVFSTGCFWLLQYFGLKYSYTLYTCLGVSLPGIYNSYKIYERKSLRVWVLALKLGKQVETNLANIGSRGEVEREKQHLLEAHRKATNLLCSESMWKS